MGRARCLKDHSETPAPQSETLIARVLARTESVRFETKRVSGKMVGKALETICAFANTEPDKRELTAFQHNTRPGYGRGFSFSEPH